MTTVTKADREAAAAAFECLPFYSEKWNGRDFDIVDIDELRTAAVQAWVETGDNVASKKLDNLLVNPDGTPMVVSVYSLELSAKAIAKARELATAQAHQQCVGLVYAHSKQCKDKNVSMSLFRLVEKFDTELFDIDPSVCPVHDMLAHGKEAETLRTGIEYILSAYRLQHGKEDVEKLYQKGLEELLDSTAATDSEAYCERQAKKGLDTQDAENLAAFRAHPHANYLYLVLDKLCVLVTPEELREAVELARKVLNTENL
jgi:hypothetical protein